MIVKDISFSSPEQNILFDEALFELAEKADGGEVLRFWESPIDFIVLGRISREDEDVNKENVLSHHIPVLRRASGGGTVIQGEGCLNFTLILSKSRAPEMEDIKKSYEYILSRIVIVLSTQGIKGKFFPISDLALLDGKKFSGNAQKRGRKFVLHHGTILYNFDLKKVERYLLMPKAMPEYRAGRKHLDFVTNVPLNPAIFKKDLAASFKCSSEEHNLTSAEQRALDDLVTKRDVIVSL